MWEFDVSSGVIASGAVMNPCVGVCNCQLNSNSRKRFINRLETPVCIRNPFMVVIPNARKHSLNV